MREAFYLTTYDDTQALNDPKFTPRNAWRYGPFSSYETAAMYPVEHPGEVKRWTHFKVDKMFVKDQVRLKFIDMKPDDSGG